MVSYLDMKHAPAPPILSSPPKKSAEVNNIVTLGNYTGPGSILVGVGNSTNPSKPTREQLYNCLDGNNSALYICRRFILPNASSEILFSVTEKTNQIYVATTNSYVYRLLGSDVSSGATINVSGTVINIPDFIAVAQGKCSSNAMIVTDDSPPTDVSIVTSSTLNISYQNSSGIITTPFTIPNSAKSTNFTVCATNERTPGIIPVPIRLEGTDKLAYYTNKSELVIVVSAPLSY